MALQTFSRRVQLHRLLVCCPHLNAVLQKRTVFYNKKTFWKQDIANWLYHDYKFNLQELTAYQNKKQLEEIKGLQTFDETKVMQMGPDLAFAEILMRLGGKVKFLDDDIWYRKFEDGSIPTPRHYEEGYHVEGIDASNIILLYSALDYLNHLKHVQFIRLSRSKYVDDWYIEKILETCPNIEALDLSDCPNITDNGFEILHRFKNLKVVNITNCHKVRGSEAICALLEDFCPDLTVIGLNSLPRFKRSEDLHDYELETSRYMNWGNIMNKRLGLNNDINFDQFFESKMEKTLNASASTQPLHDEQEDDDTQPLHDERGVDNVTYERDEKPVHSC